MTKAHKRKSRLTAALTAVAGFVLGMFVKSSGFVDRAVSSSNEPDDLQ